MNGKLILIRHSESEWNKLGKWTGIRDRHLTEEGFRKSEELGLVIQGLNIQIDCAFASMQVRTIETLSCILETCQQYNVPTEHSAALNERDYGEYTGKNKYEMEKLVGTEEWTKIRRGWDHPIPKGETLKMVYERTIPYFLENVLPKIKEGKNILVVAHGNSLRSILKYIENISEENISDIEFNFATAYIYTVDNSGHMENKEVRALESIEAKRTESKHIHTQIVATLGPTSNEEKVILQMINNGLDVVRLNLSWGTKEDHKNNIKNVREAAKKSGKHIPILLDLPGPRIQELERHTYDHTSLSCVTEKDKEFIAFGIDQQVDYFAVSFVGTKSDIEEVRNIIKTLSGEQKIIAKIERKIAVDNFDEIIEATDAVMIARGDLGDEIPIEKIPFIQSEITKKCISHEKPVITATQMMLSMTDNVVPTRAEVTDVAYAILLGSNAVMLSEETARGKNPVLAVATMEKVIIEAEKHITFNPQTKTLKF